MEGDPCHYSGRDVPTPGSTLPPLFSVIAPEIVPLPPSTPSELTVTGPVPVAEPDLFLASSVAEPIVVPPL